MVLIDGFVGLLNRRDFRAIAYCDIKLLMHFTTVT
jgi:hypothetical protein